MDHLSACMHSRIGTASPVDYQWLARDACNRSLQRSLHRRTMLLALALKAMIVGAIVLNTTRDFHTRGDLYEGDLRDFSRIAFAPTQFGNTRIATRTIDITRSQFVKHLLDNQFIGQRTQDMASSSQLDNHRFVCCLKGLRRLILV